MRTAMLVLAPALALVAAASDAGAGPRTRSEVAIAEPRPRTPVVRIASASDASPGVLDAHARRRHGEIVRRALTGVLERGAARGGIAPRQLDATVVAWRVTSEAGDVSVTAELRVVVCDHHGRMLSIVTGRARVSAPAGGARLGELREQALAEAVGGMTGSLQSQLVRTTS